MRTDDLIGHLSGALEPTPPSQVLRILAVGLGTGAVLSAIVMFATIGVRPDMMDAMGDGSFWLKFVYTFMIAVLCFATVDRLARPDAAIGRFFILLIVPFLVMAGVAAREFLPADAAAQHALIMGH